MATSVQRRRGTTAEHATFTGALAEITVDTTKDTAVVHDGATAGGFPLLLENGSNSALSLGSAGTPSLKFTGDPNTGIFSPGADQLSISTGGVDRLRVASTGDVVLSATGYLDLPTGTTAERPGSPNSGMIRFNSTLGQFEGYNGTAWSSVGGGATGGGADTVFIENSQTVTTNYTLSTNKNAVSAGPVTVNTGVTVTIPSGASWVIV